MTVLQEVALETKNIMREALAHVPAHNEAGNLWVIKVEEHINKLEAAVQNEIDNPVICPPCECPDQAEAPLTKKQQRAQDKADAQETADQEKADQQAAYDATFTNIGPSEQKE